MPSLDSKRRAAAAIMAFAVMDLFPKTKLVYGEETEFGFFYDFVFTSPPDQQFLQILDDRMRFIMADAKSIVSKTMMRENAANYFFHHKQEYLGEIILETLDNLISLIEIDGVVLPCKEPHIATTKEIPFFKIHEMRAITPEIIRIEAFGFDTKDELKKFIKKFEEAKKRSPLKIGPEIGLVQFVNDQCLLMPRGVILKNIILNKLRQEYASLGFDEVEASLEYHPYLARAKEHFLQKDPVRMVSFDGEFLDNASIFCTSDKLNKELTSSLQFIIKIIKMLFVEYALVAPTLEEDTIPPVGTKVELRFIDAIGRSLEGAFIEVDRSQVPDLPFVIRFSSSGEMKRLFSLMIERFAGSFPLHLAPEQVRILPLSPRHRACAERVRDSFEKANLRSFIDAREEPLGFRMHLARQEKIPYTCVIGDEELKTEGEVTIRALEAQSSKKVSLSSFLERLSKEVNHGE